MDNGASVVMDTKSYVKEHKELIKVLDKCGAKGESAKQKKEMKATLMDKSVVKGRKGSKPVTKMRRDSGSSMSSYDM
jgi:type II secretory pathway component GspD/PulD (secretin)